MDSNGDLANKRCTPCKGDLMPLKGAALLFLYEQLAGNWKIIDEHHLEKEYFFQNFKQALAFTNKVGEIAESQGHHPDLLLSYGKVKITLWTHKINGLSESDFIMAAKCDKIALPN